MFTCGGGLRYGFVPGCPEPAAERAERSEASEAAVKEQADELGDTFSCSHCLFVTFLLGCWGPCRYVFACPEPAAERAERSEASEAAVEEPADELGDTFSCSLCRLVTFLLGCWGQCWYVLASFVRVWFPKGRPWKKKTQLAQQHVLYMNIRGNIEPRPAQT